MTLWAQSTSYNLNSFIPQDWRGWDDYWNRIRRYDVFEGYYHNIAYHTIVSYSQSLKTTERLYKHVRGVYNPVKRLVEAYVSKIVGGELDMQNAQTGALPIKTENALLIPALTTLWKDSRWGQKKSLYVRNGAMKGDSYIKIVDDVQNGIVRLEVLDPAKIKRLDESSDGAIEYVEIEYYLRDDNGRLQTYNETITPERFKVTLDRQPFGRPNGRGERVPEWDNEYGFVPIVHVQHLDVNLKFGAPAFHGSMHKINELNDLASILNDGSRKQVQMPLVTINAEITSADLGSDQSSDTQNPHDKPRKDSVGVLNLTGDNADIKPLAPSIDLANGLQIVLSVLDELERDLPELSLHRLRNSTNATAPGIRSVYDDAIARFTEGRGNYYAGLVDAHKMGVAIGGFRGYEGYQGFNLMSREDGSLDHSISGGAVISDTLSKSEKLSLTLQAMSGNAPASVYRELGWDDSDVEELVATSQGNTNSFLMSQATNPTAEIAPPEDDEATPEDAFTARQNGGVNEADLARAQRMIAA